MLAASELRDNLAQVRERIAVAARNVRRAPEEITLIGVSKTQSAEAIRELYYAGLRHFGENRVQEWESKQGAVADLGAHWHLIGHLQSNKAARAAKLFASVDSVDSLSPAQRLARAWAEKGTSERLRVLLEVHLGAEKTKSGVEPERAVELAEAVAKLPQLHLRGFMCIPPFLEADAVRRHFRQLRELRDRVQQELSLDLPVLSMGMSHDFEFAIEEGATEVRVGTALFGGRLNR